MKARGGDRKAKEKLDPQPRRRQAVKGSPRRSVISSPFVNVANVVRASTSPCVDHRASTHSNRAGYSERCRKAPQPGSIPLGRGDIARRARTTRVS
jgi:hypothetical protein